MSFLSTLTTVDTYTWGNCSNCSEVNLNDFVPNSWEPGAGTDKYSINRPNFGPSTPNYDDSSLGTPHYYKDQNFYDLCGPGAADIALEYWPWPPNLGNYTATDPWNNTTTTWDGADLYDRIDRARGYMVDLAWKINPGNHGGTLGLMQGGSGTTDSRMRDGLNWEASGENTSNWTYYFYVIGSGSSAQLHSAVQSDIGSSNVPLLLLVNAALLPNWPSQPPGTAINHYITIVGYNDSTGQYAYSDTCGNSTNCGSKHDGGINVASQSAMYNATYEWIW